MRSLSVLVTSLFVVALVLAPTFGQSLVQQHGVVVAASGGAVPGVPGATFHASPFDSGVLDANGNLLFRGRMIGGGSTAFTDRALFTGSGPWDLSILIRGSDAAPGLPGVTCNSAFAGGLGGSPRLSADGNTLFGSLLSGVGVTTANDSAMFGGPVGAPQLFVRKGDVAPSTTGAVYSSALNNLGHQGTGFNTGFQMLFQSTLTGGDVVGTTNERGWFTGAPGSLVLMQRKGDAIVGGGIIGSLGFISQMNASGQVLHDEQLSTTVGTATVANNQTLWVYTPGFGNALLAREGDAAPGTVGATFNNGANTWSFQTGANTFNSSGNCVFYAELLNGDAVVGTNDSALYVGGIGSLSLALRKGDAAPGTDGFFGVQNAPNLCLNNAGQIAFQSNITGGTSTPANDSGIWVGTPGNFQLIVREGDLAPGTPGCTFGSPMSHPMQLSAQGQVVFRVNLAGGDVVLGTNEGAEYIWDPVLGMQLYWRKGDSIEILPGVFKTLNTGGGIQFNNGDGSPLSFNPQGWLLTTLFMMDGTQAIMKTRMGSLTGTPPTLSELTGGAHILKVNAGAAHAGETYVIVGSLSGNSPGVFIGPYHLPLNPDFYTEFMLTNANIGPFVNTAGLLDANGRAAGALVLPPLPGLAGLIFDHAYAVLDGGLNLVFISESARLQLVP